MQDGTTFLQQRTHPSAVPVLTGDAGESQESKPDCLFGLESPQDCKAFFLELLRSVTVTIDQGVPPECAEHQAGEQSVAACSNVRYGLFEHLAGLSMLPCNHTKGRTQCSWNSASHWTASRYLHRADPL